MNKKTRTDECTRVRVLVMLDRLCRRWGSPSRSPYPRTRCKDTNYSAQRPLIFDNKTTIFDT